MTTTFVLGRVAGRRLAPRAVKRWRSAAAVPMTESPSYYEAVDSQRSKPPDEVKVTKLSNGITVASLENHSYSSSLSLYVQAGSRFETYAEQGVTHHLRNAAFFAAGGRSTFRVAREMDNVGGTLSATTTREHMIYRAQVLRGNQDLALDILSKAVVSPDLRDWEIQDLAPKVAMEVTEHENDPESYVLETLHQAAFRNALSNSLYTPKFNIGCITANTLKSYMDSWFLGRRITLVGIGVDHAELVSMAQSSLSSAREGLSTDEETSHYYGGGEVLSPTQASLTHSAIVSKGASLGSQDVLLAGVLQHLMGVGVSVKWGGSPSRLQKAGSETTDAPFNACTVNLNYSDNGLFGFFVTSEPQDTEKLLRAVMQNFNSIAKGDISDADLTRAKNQLKASYLMPVEQSSSLSDDIAAQVSLNGEYTPLTATNQKVDAITNDELIQFAKGVFGTRSTFVARGNLSSTPRMQQLLEGVSLR